MLMGTASEDICRSAKDMETASGSIWCSAEDMRYRSAKDMETASGYIWWSAEYMRMARRRRAVIKSAGLPAVFIFSLSVWTPIPLLIGGIDFINIFRRVLKLFCLKVLVHVNNCWVPGPNLPSISSSKVRVKKRGHGQGQSSSGSAGGSGAGNAVRSRGTGGGENGRTGLAMGEGRSGNVGGGGRRRGNNGGDEENNGGDMGGNLDLNWWERAVTIFTVIMALIQGILNLCGSELSSITTTGSVIGYFSTITSLLALVCYEVVRRQPYLNPRLAGILNPRIIGILSGTGSALAVLGFISRMAIDLPLHLSPIFILAFLILLIFFLVDIL